MISRLTEADFNAAADTLHLPLAVLQAVAEVESKGQGFLPDGRPVMLFERHIFWRQLKQHGLDAAALASAYPGVIGLTPGGYQGGIIEYERLAMAQQIHEAAAYESASWGAFQVMGFHWKALGYASVEDFVRCMQHSERDHLDAFVRYLNYQPALIKALQHQQWADFARGYNGPSFARHAYDIKLAQAWTSYAQGTALAERTA